MVEQFKGAEWLGQVEVRIEDFGFIFRELPSSRQDDDRGRFGSRIRSDLFADFLSPDPRHHEVEDQEIRSFLETFCDRFGAILGFDDEVFFTFQSAVNQEADRNFIISNQDLLHRLLRWKKDNIKRPFVNEMAYMERT